jgi:hypothetical protein
MGCKRCWVGGDPPPATGLAERVAQDRVDLAHGGRRQRLAAGTAPGAQGGVEAVEGRGVQAPEWQVAERRKNGSVDVALIGDPRAPREISHLKPTCKELRDGRVSRWPLALVDLIEQAGTQRLRLALGPSRAGEVAALAGDRVVAGVDDDPPG